LCYVLSVHYQVHFHVYSVELHTLYIFLLKCLCFFGILFGNYPSIEEENDLICCQMFGRVVEF
jgi:hypothetical protein